MSPAAEQVLQSALALPAEDLFELVEALMAAQEEADPQPLSEAWMAELARRSAEADANPGQGIPWEVVQANARARWQK